MRDTVLGWEEAAIEDFARVTAGEVPRLGDGVEDLKRCCTVDRKVVDRFVWNGVVRDERRFG